MAKWQCTACGRTWQSGGGPSNTAGGKCPDTSSGNHMWSQIG